MTTALRDLQLPAARVMAVSGHKSEIQMRRDYHAATGFVREIYVIESLEIILDFVHDSNKIRHPTSQARHSTWANSDPATRSKASLSMWRYISGDIPRLPDTAVDAYQWHSISPCC